MTELARGAVGDRPWGRTLGALGTRGLSGQLTLVGDGKPYRIAFHEGAVVGASSPLTSDAAVRVALTGGLITSTQVPDITRRIATSPHRDEVEVLAEVARLSPDHATKLRRRLVAQRAARTFSVEHGDFVVEDQIAISVVPGSELDVRAVIYLGARANLTEDRLATEVGTLGGWFQLKPEVVGDLAQFGFTEPDKPVLRKLVSGASLDELEVAASEGVGSHGVRAIVYALVSCNACDVEARARATLDRPGSRSTPPLDRSASTTAAPRNARATTPPRVNVDGTAPPFGGAAGQARVPAVDGTAPPFGGAAGQARVPAVDGTAPPFGGAAGQARVPAVDGTAPPFGGAAGQARVPAVEVPEGMQIRSPRTTSSPVARTLSTPPPNVRTTGPQPIVTIGPATRSQTPSSQPAVARTPTNPTPTGPMQPRTTTGPLPGRTPTPSDLLLGRTPTTPFVGRATTPASTPATARVPTNPAINRTPTPDLGRTRTPSQLPETADARRAAMPRVKRNTAAAQETELLIRDRLVQLERGADHFVLLGIAQDASPDVTRSAYFTLQRKLHPDRVASLGIADAQRDAQRLCAQINAAFAILNDPGKRAEYVQMLGRGGEALAREEDAKAGALAMRAMHAEEAFRRGEMALRREQLDQALLEFTTALELEPNELEFQALLAWTKFAAASDKAAIAAETRNKLTRAIDQTQRSPTAQFYLGRVERILGREREALAHFQDVLRIKPNHAEASSEIRVLEARLKKR